MKRKYFVGLCILIFTFILINQITHIFKVSHFLFYEKLAKRGKLFYNTPHTVPYDSSIVHKNHLFKALPLQLQEDTTFIRDLQSQHKVTGRSSEQQDAATPNTFQAINNASFVVAYVKYFCLHLLSVDLSLVWGGKQCLLQDVYFQNKLTQLNLQK